MSSLVFPVLKGLTWDRKIVPMTKTNVQEAVSGRESRTSFMLYPKYRIELTFNVLRSATAYQELQKIAGLFRAMKGRYDSFLYSDNHDVSVTDQQIGVLDGTTLTWQLLRTYGVAPYTFIEPIANVNTLTNLKRAGVTLSSPADYSVSATGLVTLTSGGTLGQSLTWTGSYYFRCRFDKDEAEFNQFLNGLYEYRKCTLIGSLGVAV